MIEDGERHGAFIAGVLDDVFDSFRGVIPFDRLGYARFDGVDRVKCIWMRSENEADCAIKPGYWLPLSETSLGSLRGQSEPRVINDLVAYLASRPDSKSTRLAVADGIRSSLTAPIRDSGNVVGFLFFSSFAPNTYAGLDHSALLGLSRLFSGTVSLERERQEAHAQGRAARFDADHDRLTGILNRRGLEVTFQNRYLDPYAHRDWHLVAFVDVDRMKVINDQQGHAVGDEVLRRVAIALTESTREGDLVAWIGGDEFVVVAAFTDKDGLMAQRLAESIAERVADLSRDLNFTVSVGLDWVAPGAQLPDALLLADDAMYRDKNRVG